MILTESESFAGIGTTPSNADTDAVFVIVVPPVSVLNVPWLAVGVPLSY